MILIDIGNSTTEIALFENEKIKTLKVLETQNLDQFIRQNHFKKETPLIISSVVPAKNKLFKKYPKATFIDHTNIPILKLNLDNPKEVGSDRLVTALAAYTKTKGSCLVIDSGTATTFCYVSSKGIYEGGAIIPGLKISSKALNQFTAKIPLIWVKPSDKLFGKNTKDAVQIGLYRSAIYTINGFIESFRKKDPKITVVGTGSIKIFKDKLKLDIWDEDLILKGLAIAAKYVS